MGNVKTGPAVDEEEAHQLASLMRDPGWPRFKEYLTRIQLAAFNKHMRLGQGVETNGYYKGVWNLANDLIHLDVEIGKQIFSETDKEQGDPGL
ncbi:MAG TPA: hypothetical protein VMW06_03330 [Desulfobacterales bacterium]|nr:hypothetical protein [Desulfobacterales bacterium]